MLQSELPKFLGVAAKPQRSQMSRSSQTLVPIILAALSAVSWGAGQAIQKRPHVVKVRKTLPAPTPDQTLPPPPPPTPEQMPAQPPQVSFLNGQLTIIAQNSTLGDILNAVRRQTGAVIEMPPGGAGERVAGRMGPGPARNVLAELLNGSRYDYVMIASPTNPAGVEHLILTPKAGGPEAEGTPMASNPAPQPQPMPESAPEPEVPPDVDMSETPAEEPPPQQEEQGDQAQQQPPAVVQPEHAPTAVPPGSPDGQQGVKTPEQLLQELQRMQQQQQQQQQPQPQEQQPQQ